ncbi:unnamed protein product [Prunus brigantina]
MILAFYCNFCKFRSCSSMAEFNELFGWGRFTYVCC